MAVTDRMPQVFIIVEEVQTFLLFTTIFLSSSSLYQD